MRAFLSLVIGLFSYTLVDLNRIRTFQRAGKTIPVTEMAANDLAQAGQRKSMRKRRRYKNKKWKKRDPTPPPRHSLSGTHAKDHRYSNQRTLRRMYRNG